MTDLVSTPQRTAANAEQHIQLAGAWLLSLSSDQTRRAFRCDLLELFGFLDAIGTGALAADRPRIDGVSTSKAPRIESPGLPVSVVTQAGAHG